MEIASKSYLWLFNHYGLDLCGCGSGELYGECEEDYDACKLPMQVIEKYNHVVAATSPFASVVDDGVKII